MVREPSPRPGCGCWRP